MNWSWRLLLGAVLSLLVAACDFVESFEPPPDETEAALTAVAAEATFAAEQATFRARLTAEAPTPTGTPTATPSPSPVPSGTPTLPPSPTPDMTATLIAATCTGDHQKLLACFNGTVLSVLMPDVEPERRLVDNADPKTLYSRPEVLEVLGKPETTMRHNVYTRPESCPLAAPCVLQTLLLTFGSPADAERYFDLVTDPAASPPDETVFQVPNVPSGGIYKCANHGRPATQAGAPDFAVVYCTLNVGTVSFGFNLSAYESLPPGLVENQLGPLLNELHQTMTVWNATNAALVDIRWLTSLDTGSPAAESAVQQVLDDFNASQLIYKLTAQTVISPGSITGLRNQIAARPAPDIAGPVVISAAEILSEHWIDLSPLIEQTGYNLSQFDSALLDLYRTEDGGLNGLPFTVHPSMVFYNRDLFDAAGLSYPPQSYGEPYVLPDGTRTEWNYGTVADIAQLLTVDANGNNATDPGFDPANIVQYGFDFQDRNLHVIGAAFGPGSLQTVDGQTVAIPDAWQAAWQWAYAGTWSGHFIPSQAARDSAAFGSGNPFNAGKLAMNLAPLGYTCCLGEAGGNWGIAPVPAYNGQTTVYLYTDSFHVLNSAQNPEAAFEVMTYLVGDGSPALLDQYSGLPARTADQDAYLNGLNEQFPQGVNWQVAVDGLAYAGNPSFGSNLTNSEAVQDRLDALGNAMFTAPGLALDAEIGLLEADLRALILGE